VIAFENLLRAAARAARGKRGRTGVARFLERLEPELLALQGEGELHGGTYRPGRPITFRISDPKNRTISAAPFRDRVVHHALIGPLEPILDRRMLDESFACRRGKGSHAALRHARRLVRRHEFFLKMDVRGFFESLHHHVVLETLQRFVKDRDVLRLIERIVRDGHRNRGLPIGSLTSQWFANIVLDRLDHETKQVWRVPGYVRYMDDFVLFADDKGRLRELLPRTRAYLEDNLKLTLKDRATILAPVEQGLPFLGWRIYRGTTRLRTSNLRRTRRRLNSRVRAHQRGRMSEQQLADAVRSVTAHLAHGDTLALRRGLFTNSEGSGL
jgi:hypothetical protein